MNLKVASFEIYCDTIIDLLSPTAEALKLILTKKGTVIKDLIWESVSTEEELK